MTKRRGRLTVVLAIIFALGGAALIVANAPRTSADETPSAAFGH